MPRGRAGARAGLPARVPHRTLAPVTTSSASLPLAGLRILAPTQLGAGPFGLMFLADLGAEVVKIENPGTRGDEARTVPPFNDPAAHDGLYFQALNRGARSVTLDLKHPDGRAVLHRLVPRFDAVFHKLRGDQTAVLGLDYAALAPFNPRIVSCSLSGFGRTGPRRDEPAYDYLLQAYAGFMSLTGEPDAPPTKSGVSVVDFSGGILAALALMIGLHRAQRTGMGADVDVSLLDTALSMLNYMAAWSLDRGWVPARHPDGAHQSLVPNQTFRTADGWIVVMAMKQKFWERLVERVGLPGLAADARFAGIADRLAHRTALIPLLRTIVTGARLSGKPSTRWSPDAVQDVMHAKVVVADDVSFVGSYNFSRSGELNAENVLEIADTATADALATYVDEVRALYPPATLPDG